MDHSTPGIRRLCIAVDVEGYSRRDDPGQLDAQDGLITVLEEACANAHLDRVYWERQPQGDGELALLPPGVDETRVVADFLHELGISLYQRNRHRDRDAKLRMRVAAHQGITQLGANGFSGSAVVTVCRLLDAPELKEALKANPGVDLALIVSGQLYHDIIEPDYRDLRAATFRRVHVSDERRGFSADAWIHIPKVPGGRPDTSEPEDGEAPPPPPSAWRAGDRARQVVENHNRGVIVGEQVNLGIQNLHSDDWDG